ncbi:Threonine dehydrogenase [Nannocystis exedens]|uniref:Threonine dehydrogenase n=1 Tax=Nannocystis exedens TaxID=54 RepID=A0A1I2HRN4_9BACT|nr:zinc-dependent alcohol dehydrogenase [Nannocystis exedens]PCC69371.1 glutathione-dependent formaldehyde dehydrogenase [Nannocystis exedens]SFF31366.1 Threonine dehydrogenase [Nannocystis exedens]
MNNDDNPEIPRAQQFAEQAPSTMMKALEWHGAQDVRVVERPRPVLGEDHDVIVRVTATTICGSDLHLYHHSVPGMRVGDVLGHECMGIVEEAGPAVQSVRSGDRVVVSAVIAEGNCAYCQAGLYSLCDVTNPSEVMEALYGHCTAGIFGYSHLTGGYDGGQAEFIRVPFADVNCLPVPPTLSDEQVLFLSDIVSTGWHANELGAVQPGDTVAVWGCGPVGLMAQAWARVRGAERVIAIDRVKYRLNVARQALGSEAIDLAEDDVMSTLRELTRGRGPDVAIEAVGFRYPKTLLHKVERALKLETDAIDTLTEAIRSLRKGGRLAIVGDYFGYANHLPVGAMMEKGLIVRGAQVHVQSYWRDLLRRIELGELDPTFVISHRMRLDEAAEAYRLFDRKEDNALKIVLRP